MIDDVQNRRFPYRRPAEIDGDRRLHRPVIVVGAGPVGLVAAIDLAQRGVPTLLLDDDDTLSSGSRAICFAKRSLEIMDRLDCALPMLDKGVSWNIGKVFLQDELIYTFDLMPEGDHHYPAFINLQQYYVEGFLAERAGRLENLEVRWKHLVTGVEQDGEGVIVTVSTPDGEYRLAADYLVAADGSRSALRRLMGLESHGHTFRDRFLIADVKMQAEFPTERWFWFDPPFHPRQSALLHRQPDNVWRIDFQLGWDADPVLEKEPERVKARVRAMLGPEAQFELEWVSVYTFSCSRMERFGHGRVFFAGDAAHGVSPFGARGANGGIQDADNLAWKLARVIHGQSPPDILLTYDEERIVATDENILNSTRSTDFITPKSAMSRIFRDAVLKLAKHHEFARRLVNSGRLSVPAVLANSSLITADEEPFGGSMLPGAPCVDAPVCVNGRDDWLLAVLGSDFCCVHFIGEVESLAHLASATIGEIRSREPELKLIMVLSRRGDESAVEGSSAPPLVHDELIRLGKQYGVVSVEDSEGRFAQRYDARAGTTYLVRPDQHVSARWRAFSPAKICAAMSRAAGFKSTAVPTGDEGG